MPEPTDTAASLADVTQQLAQTPSWGQGGSFVLDPASGERLTEQAWHERQAAQQPPAPEPVAAAKATNRLTPASKGD